MAQPGWAIPWNGDTLVWSGIEALTVSRLRAFKSWYGPEYGKAYSFNLQFLQGDVDAVACVIWALLKEKQKGDPSLRVPDSPNQLPDFSVGELVSNTVHEPDPTLGLSSEELLTPDLTEISTNSGERPLEGVRSSGVRRRSSTN